MRLRLGLGLCGLLLAGCTFGNSKLADEDTLAQIKVGQTTREQIVSLLGDPPEKRSPLPGGRSTEWWTYSYSSSTINPLDYILLYGFWVNGLGTPDTRHVLDVFYGPDGVVITVAHTKTDYDMGGPSSPIKVTSTTAVDISLNRAAPPIHFDDKMDRRYQ